MDLALNNLQRLICYKTQPTNQPTNQLIFTNGKKDSDNKIYFHTIFLKESFLFKSFVEICNNYLHSIYIVLTIINNLVMI